MLKCQPRLQSGSLVLQSEGSQRLTRMLTLFLNITLTRVGNRRTVQHI